MIKISSQPSYQKTQRPGRCLNEKTPQCSISPKMRDCTACQAQHIKENIEKHPTAIDLSTYISLGPREKINYIYKHKLRKKYTDYKPSNDNPIATSANLSKIRSFHDLSMDHFLYLCDQLQQTAEENSRQKMQATGTPPIIIDDRIQEIRDTMYQQHSEYKKDDNENIITNKHGETIKNPKKDIIIESVLYNINQKKHTFHHHLGKLKNTVFNEITNEHTAHDLTETFAPIVDHPAFTYKDAGFDLLSNQIQAIIDGDYPRPTDFSPSPENKQLLSAYHQEVCRIENLVKSKKYLGDGLVKDSFYEILGYITSKGGIDEQDIVTTDTKNVVRATEKVINNYKMDMRGLTDVSRGAIQCRSAKDMLTKISALFASIDQYNKNLSPSSTKPKVTDLGIVSKIGPLDGLPPLSSGYGDAKYHIQFSNGSIIELQFQIDVLYEGKTKGFDRLNKLSNAQVIHKLNFSIEEQKEINKQINKKNIDIGGYSLFNLPDDYLLPGDTVYHIYRSLPGFDAHDASSPTVKKLQLLEREIHMEGRRRNIKNVMSREQKNTHQKNDDALRSKLGI